MISEFARATGAIGVRTLLGSALLVAAATAQTGVVGPPAVDDPLLRDYVNAAGVFHPTQRGVGNIQQINFVADPGLPPGVYHTTMTVSANPNNPQGGGGDVWCGIFDVSTNTFTPSNDVDAFNTTAYEFGLMYNGSGVTSNGNSFAPATVAVWDDGTLVRCTYRTAVGQAWAPHQAISNAPGGFIDPTLASINGSLYLLYVGGGSGGQTIWMDQLNITVGPSPAMSLALNPRMLVDATAVAAGGYSGTPHSPTPVLGSDGNLQGLVFNANDPTGDSDTYWISAVDGTGKVFRINDATGWSNNGGVIGGWVHQAFAVGIYHTYNFQQAFLTGDDERATRGQPNRQAAVDVHVPPDPTGLPWAALLLIDGALVPGGPIPGPFLPLISGDLAVQYSGLIPPFPMPTPGASTGRSGVLAPVPATLAGTIYVQAILVHPTPLGALQGWLSNDVAVRL